MADDTASSVVDEEGHSDPLRVAAVQMQEQVRVLKRKRKFQKNAKCKQLKRIQLKKREVAVPQPISKCECLVTTLVTPEHCTRLLGNVTFDVKFACFASTF